MTSSILFCSGLVRIVDTSKRCCFPTTGKPPADFIINGFWPSLHEGSYPSNCNGYNRYNPSKVSDLISRLQQQWPTSTCPSGTGSSLWSNEWVEHGTCSESVLDQHSYFATALNLKKKLNILKLLGNAGIKPDGKIYSSSNIVNAIHKGIGHAPFIECNKDLSGKSQLHQIYICVDFSGSELIECPISPGVECSSSVKFPTF